MAVSADRFRMIFFQGHPEYDASSLLKEYKREVMRFIDGDMPEYPPFPENYLDLRAQAILDEYRDRLCSARKGGGDVPEFPEDLLTQDLDNTWHDTAEAVVNNWIGKVYQVTHRDRKKPFMDGVDPDDPLDLLD